MDKLYRDSAHVHSHTLTITLTSAHHHVQKLILAGLLSDAAKAKSSHEKCVEEHAASLKDLEQVSSETETCRSTARDLESECLRL